MYYGVLICGAFMPLLKEIIVWNVSPVVLLTGVEQASLYCCIDRVCACECECGCFILVSYYYVGICVILVSQTRVKPE